ncbi:MAG: N-acetylneuraminate synthase family protein [Bacteroidota bacterium]|nr:N-acetylneuraminate synthase family protein [Bacteroidota bacterium]
MKVIGIIQARMLSGRLRGKSLMAVNGIPLLYRVIRSVQKLKFIDEIIIATTKSEADDPIVAAAKELTVLVYRGDSVNVLKRFKEASSNLDEEDCVVRFTADNPIYVESISNLLFEQHKNNNNDYTYIEGLSHIVPEFIKIRALREIDQLAASEFDREHVTPYFRKHKDQFKTESLEPISFGLRPDLDRFFTLDTGEDLDRLERMFSELPDEYDIQTYFVWLEKNIRSIKSPTTKQILLGNQLVGEDQQTFIIAEIGQNHNGDIEIAKKLIDLAVRCGANAVKFQKRDVSLELTHEAFNKKYDSPNSFGETYGDHRTFLELDEEQHLELKEYALAQGIPYFCTPCDIPSLELLERIGTSYYKVASRDLTNLLLLEAIAKTNKPVIISTGMASLEDIDDAIDILGKHRHDIIILQCTSQYPAELDKVNLNAMETLKNRYNKIIGFSDHTPGIIASVAASIMGASIVEKHITLSRAMKGSDQAGSLEEPGLKLMVKYIREAALLKGDGIKEWDPVTHAAKMKLSRSITSKVPINKGERIVESMLCLKSPGVGMKWKEKNQLIGKMAIHDIPADQTIFLKDVE